MGRLLEINLPVTDNACRQTAATRAIYNILLYRQKKKTTRPLNSLLIKKTHKKFLLFIGTKTDR